MKEFEDKMAGGREKVFRVNFWGEEYGILETHGEIRETVWKESFGWILDERKTGF